MGHKFGVSKKEYQEAITAHFVADHKDLHYDVDGEVPAMRKAKARAVKILRANAEAAELKRWGKLSAMKKMDPDEWDEPTIEGGLDTSSQYLDVARPRELPDLTEFDYPDATVTDGSSEEIELDQLISIQARQGRRFLGVEMQGLAALIGTEWQTMADVDLQIAADMELNTRTGAQNLDDPENLWRARYDIVTAVSSTAGTNMGTIETKEDNFPPKGGFVYVSPRLFWRFTNNLDSSVTAGQLFVRIATVSQRLSTFLLFELLEQYSGLFGLT